MKYVQEMGDSKETRKCFLRVRGGARVGIRRTQARASPARNASANTDRDTTNRPDTASSRESSASRIRSPSPSSDSDDYEDHYASSRHEPLEVQASEDVEEPGYQSDEDEPRWDYDDGPASVSGASG